MLKTQARNKLSSQMQWPSGGSPGYGLDVGHNFQDLFQPFIDQLDVLVEGGVSYLFQEHQIHNPGNRGQRLGQFVKRAPDVE